MYSDILGATYSQVSHRFQQFVSTDVFKRVITLRNTDNIDSYSNDSDIVIYYSVIKDASPLLVVERLEKYECKFSAVKRFVKKLNKELIGYIANYQISKNKQYIDIILVKDNLYENLTK